MKLYTHALFASSLVAITFCILKPYLTVPVSLQVDAMVFAFFIQYVIDIASHEAYSYKGQRYYRRSKLFHSPSGATLLGVATGVLLYLLYTYPSFVLDTGMLALAIMLMLEATYSHLLLDLPTGRGIYINGRRTWRKQRISSMNPILNGIVVLVSLVMFYYYIVNCL